MFSMARSMLTSPICSFDAGPISYPFRAGEGNQVSSSSRYLISLVLGRRVAGSPPIETSSKICTNLEDGQTTSQKQTSRWHRRHTPSRCPSQFERIRFSPSLARHLRPERKRGEGEPRPRVMGTQPTHSNTTPLSEAHHDCLEFLERQHAGPHLETLARTFVDDGKPCCPTSANEGPGRPADKTTKPRFDSSRASGLHPPPVGPCIDHFPHETNHRPSCPEACR